MTMLYFSELFGILEARSKQLSQTKIRFQNPVSKINIWKSSKNQSMLKVNYKKCIGTLKIFILYDRMYTCFCLVQYGSDKVFKILLLTQNASLVLSKSSKDCKIKFKMSHFYSCENDFLILFFHSFMDFYSTRYTYCAKTEFWLDFLQCS